MTDHHQVKDGQPLVDEEERQAHQERLTQAGIDTTAPHSARIWNYWLGGKDNYEVDHLVGEEINGVFDMATTARTTLHFRSRVVRYLAARGVRQFLDIGTGLPTVDNTHEIAQRVSPDARVVYVGNDPLVLAHARAPLAGGGRNADPRQER
jgi:S-adenosyl methyltransferase